MNSSELELRDCEFRLIRCGLLSPPPPNTMTNFNSSALESIESGRYAEALADCLEAMSADSDDVESLLRRVDSFVSAVGDESRVVTVMCAAVASFLAFVKSNITGPASESEAERTSSSRFMSDDSASRHLMSSGSDLVATFSHLQYLVLAKMLLMRIRDMGTRGFKTATWWLARVVLAQQRLLEDRSSSLFDILQALSRDTLQCFGTIERIAAYFGPALDTNDSGELLALLHLEAGIIEYTYSRVDSCRLHFESAEAAAGLELSVTGVLGFRTSHQVDPKAQMVLVANRSSLNSRETGQQDSNDPEKRGSNGCDQDGTFPESDILVTPKLVEKENGSEMGEEGIQVGTSVAPFSAIHQAIILAKCLLIEKSTAHDEMQRWDMAPYIEAIDAQKSSSFMIRCFCDLLRIRWESNRSRTKERALVMMENLVKGMYEPSPGVEKRILFSSGVCFPPIALLRKEYGELLVSCGLIGEAVKIFQDLELWDNLILCYRLMEKKAAAVELIKARLSVIPNDHRLWCSLGDVTNNDTCYEKALEVSNNRSARAKRSLARSAYNRGEFEASKALWESAMAMNSLYPDGWFALGAAALKAKDLDKALDGFTRAVQLDPDNGEAWNNIACLHMMRKKSKESFIAFKEALKFKRNSWQLWENFSQVSVDAGNISQALEAVRMVLELTSNKRADPDVLDRIVTEVEKRVSAKPSTSSTMIEDDTDHGSCAESSESNSRETDQLVHILGKVLQLAVRSGNGGDIWGLYARWHKLKGDLTMCSEALLKQVRSYQGSDTWKESALFKRFARASLELCNVYVEISSSTGSRKELFSAEMHLKNTIKQAERFMDTEEVIHLQSCLEDVRMKIQPPSISCQ